MFFFFNKGILFSQFVILFIIFYNIESLEILQYLQILPDFEFDTKFNIYPNLQSFHYFINC